MVSGRKSGVATRIAVTPTKSPLFVIWSRNAGPRPLGESPATRSATAMRIGMSASAPSSAQVRRRRNRVSSSDAKSEAVPPGAVRAADAPAPTRLVGASVAPASLDNVEPLAREVDEALLEARALELEPAHAHAGRDERRHDLLRLRSGLRAHAIRVDEPRCDERVTRGIRHRADVPGVLVSRMPVEPEPEPRQHLAGTGSVGRAHEHPCLTATA